DNTFQRHRVLIPTKCKLPYLTKEIAISDWIYLR
ncbi:hypothetical protein JMJ77_0006660, partial [Colletotrichum scovillei]